VNIVQGKILQMDAYREYILSLVI